MHITILIIPILYIQTVFVPTSQNQKEKDLHTVGKTKQMQPVWLFILRGRKGAGASEAPGQTKEEFSINDTSRDPKVLKIGPQHGWQ